MTEEIELRAEYEGWQISTFGDGYLALKKGARIQKKDIAKLRRAIDKVERMNKTDGFKRTTAYEAPTYSKGTITSISEIGETYSGKPRVEVWFSYADADEGLRRTRTSIGNLVRDSSHNRKLIREIVELKQEAEKLERILDFFKPEDVLKETSE